MVSNMIRTGRLEPPGSAVLTLLLAGVLLAGCATKWTKPDFEARQFERDKTLCTSEENKVSGAYLDAALASGNTGNPVTDLMSGFLGIFGLTEGSRHYDKCMESKGYSKAT